MSDPVSPEGVHCEKAPTTSVHDHVAQQYSDPNAVQSESTEQ